MTVAKEPAYLLLPQHNLAGRRQKALAEQGPGRPAAERQGQQPLLQGLLPFPLPSRLTTLLLVRQPAKQAVRHCMLTCIANMSQRAGQTYMSAMHKLQWVCCLHTGLISTFELTCHQTCDSGTPCYDEAEQPCRYAGPARGHGPTTAALSALQAAPASSAAVRCALLQSPPGDRAVMASTDNSKQITPI